MAVVGRVLKYLLANISFWRIIAVKGERNMVEILLKIIKSETYSIISPLILVLLGWIKNGYDVKEKNKELGYWKLRYRKVCTFMNIAMKIYTWMALNFGVMQGIRKAISIWKDDLLSYILIGCLYLAINFLILFLNCRDVKTKIEFWTNGKSKKRLVGVLYIILGGGFFIELFDRYEYVFELIFGISLIVWMFYLFSSTDVAYILDNRYADIYVRGSDKAEFAEAGSIRKKGEWIIVNRYVNGFDEEIRIKESDIVRIDYYGDPVFLLMKQKLFGK